MINIDVETFLNTLPWELRKNEEWQILSKTIYECLEYAITELSKTSNTSILANLRNGELERFADRYGAVRIDNWTDRDLRKRVKLLWYIWDRNISHLDNFARQIEDATEFQSEIRITDSPFISGEILATIVVPEGESVLPFADLQKFYLAGNKINLNIIRNPEFFVYNSYGNIDVERYNFGDNEPLTPTTRVLKL